jgi:peptide/nickel transport system permease protein
MKASRLDLSLLLAIGLGFALLAVALFGERLAPNEDIYFVVEHGKDPRPFDPGVVFPFGSDVLGRDLFSLVLAGAGTTLAIVVLAGLARVVAGVVVAALGSWWRPARVVTESAAQLVSAIPATVLALVLVKVFVKTDTTLLVFIGALLVIGWAGPYRVIRAELDRVTRAPFTEGARAIGVGRWRLLWRHQLPHLVPVIAINFTQQVIAALVLVAELGVIGVFVGATRLIDLQESVSAFAPGVPNDATIADIPEWGGLLAGSRSVLALYVTRWLILLPGIALALTALAVAMIGLGLARRYARRDVITDLRGRGALGIVAGVLVMFTVSGLIPERYAEASEWAESARSELRTAPDLAGAFTDGALIPVGDDFVVSREITNVSQSGPASVRFGSAVISESPWPRRLLDVPDRERSVRAFVTSATGGGVAEAPLVFAGRGISPADFQPRQQPLTFTQPDVAREIHDHGYEDDYARVDVRGKVVLLVRFFGIEAGPRSRITDGIARGPSVDQTITTAVKRGAAAVIFVDPVLWLYTDLEASATYGGQGPMRGGPNPYLRLERFEPRTDTDGIPVVVLGEVAAKQLLDPLGLDLSAYYAFDERGSAEKARSLSRDLGVTARVEVPLAKQTTKITSLVGEVAADPGDTRVVVVWAPRRPDAQHPTGDVLAALARALGSRRVPLVFVDFDLSGDPRENAKHIAQVLGDRRIDLVVVIDKLDGAALKLTTPYGEYVPAFDLYAEKAGARFETSRRTARMGEIESVTPFFTTKTVVVTGTGGEGDLRADAAALVGYLAGRLALGAPELPR